MARPKTKKERTYVCIVCGKKKKSDKQTRCCSKNMTAKDKGSWNM